MLVLWTWISAMPAAVAALIGVILATVGWLYAARRNRALSRKQHTFNALMQASFNERYQKELASVRPYIRGGVNFPDLQSPDQEPMKDTVTYLLNHYEVLAAGIRNGDISEPLLRDSEKGTITKLFETAHKFISQLRDARNRRAIFEHLEWLYVRWHENPPGALQQVFEAIMARPLYHNRHRWWGLAAILLGIFALLVLFLHLPGEAFNPTIATKLP